MPFIRRAALVLKLGCIVSTEEKSGNPSAPYRGKDLLCGVSAPLANFVLAERFSFLPLSTKLKFISEVPTPFSPSGWKEETALNNIELSTTRHPLKSEDVFIVD